VSIERANQVAVGRHVLEVGAPAGTLISVAGEAADAEALVAALRSETPETSRTAPVGEVVDVAEALTGRVETAAALFEKLASGRILDPGELEAWIRPTLDLLGRLDREGRSKEALALALAAHRVLALARRWIELLRMLLAALRAARALGDDSAVAWAQHELGTLHLAAGQFVEADSRLSEAHALRQRLGDREGVAATEQSLRVLCRHLRELLRERPRVRAPRRLVLAAVALLLLLTGAVAGAVIRPAPLKADPTATLRARVDGHGTVTGAAGRIRCPGACTARVERGRHVTLSPSAERGSTFAGWSGACSGTSRCTVLVDGPRRVTAHFRIVRETRTLSVGVEGEGEGHVTSRPAGIDCPSVCSTRVQRGAKVRLHAAPTGDATFAGWSGGRCSGTGDCIVRVRERTSVTARFATGSGAPSTLTVVLAGEGGGIVTTDPGSIFCGRICSATFDAGRQIELTAAARKDSEFAGWSGGGCSGTDPCSVTLRASKTVTATFSRRPPQRFTLSTSAEGTGTGTIAADPACDGTPCAYDPGTSVTLTAAADAGSDFTQWRGCPAAQGTTCAVTMTADQAVAAEFTKQPISESTVR
jgi:hypothetical protein